MYIKIELQITQWERRVCALQSSSYVIIESLCDIMCTKLAYSHHLVYSTVFIVKAIIWYYASAQSQNLYGKSPVGTGTERFVSVKCIWNRNVLLTNTVLHVSSTPYYRIQNQSMFIANTGAAVCQTKYQPHMQ